MRDDIPEGAKPALGFAGTVLPGPLGFDVHGSPAPTDTPAERAGIYVDAAGDKVKVTIVAERSNGAYDVMVHPEAGVPYRRDSVRRRQPDDGITGDYLE